RAAAFATALLGTSAGWLAFSHIGATDLPLAATFSAAVLLSLGWVRAGETACLPKAAGALALAVLAKGLVPLVLILPVVWAGRRRLAAQAGGRKPDSNAKNVNLAWIADDPNNDTLQYAVYYRASDETEWKLIDDKVKTTRLPLLVNGVGDGRYRFRVVATDKLDNPPGTGLEAELISDEIVIDNTPPRIEGFKVKPSGDRAEISFKAVDALSLISSISVDLDGDDAYPIYPEDGLYDQSEETVDWTTLQLKPGEHVATINVTDRRGNTSVQKAVFTIKK
ncbi:fibronectin type III domain-containing protein, partial [Candidatus Sumerlaeota bacterium]|nr:fibronectin type III domain-containing protein [Candidatus Sumerlaeota bacterium]